MGLYMDEYLFQFFIRFIKIEISNTYFLIKTMVNKTTELFPRPKTKQELQVQSSYKVLHYQLAIDSRPQSDIMV